MKQLLKTEFISKMLKMKKQSEQFIFHKLFTSRGIPLNATGLS